MPGWSDIRGLDPSAPEDRDGFEESAARVRRLMQAEMDAGIPASRIMLGGFSQGGALVRDALVTHWPLSLRHACRFT